MTRRTARRPNAQYNLAPPGSLPVRIATAQRRRIFDDFIATCAVGPGTTVLDIGATSDQSYESSNYLEAWLDDKSRITALGLDDARFLETRYPGLRFIRGNGLDLPFADASFDVVHAAAVIEHVGSFDHQVRLIAEAARVARRAFCITTPNRFFPIEVHTVLPLVHWLPKPAFRRLMQATGRDFFAREENLNLLSGRDLAAAATRALSGRPFRFAIRSVRLWGMKSNLLLYGWNPDAAA